MTAWAQTKAIDSLRQAVATATADTARAYRLCDLAWELQFQARDSALPYLQAALALSQKANDLKGLGLANVQLGNYYRQKGKYKLAIEAYRWALYARNRLHDTRGIASVYNNWGELELETGQLIEARQHLEAAIDLYSQIGEQADRVKAARNLCELHTLLGNFTRSQYFGYMALGILEGAAQPDSLELGKTFNAIGNSFINQGMYPRALTAYGKAKQCFVAANAIPELAVVLNNLGIVAEYKADYPAALQALNESLTYRLLLKDTLWAVPTMRNIAKIYRYDRKWDRALAKLQEAQDLLGRGGNLQLRALLAADEAEIYLWQGDAPRAQNMLLQLLPSFDTLCLPSQRIYIRQIMGIAAGRMHDLEAAATWNLQALQLRAIEEQQTRAGTYLYDEYMAQRREIERVRFEAEVAQQKWLRAQDRNRYFLAAIIALLVLLTVIAMTAWQRIKILENKRVAIESKLELERKEKEIDRLEQSKKMEFLQIALDVEDRERSRIAHDLHDRVGAQIAALKHLFGQMRDAVVVASPTTAQPFDKLNHELQELMSEVRAVAHDLESPTLKEFGLVAAIKGFKDMVAKFPGLDFELDIHGMDTRIDPKMERNIYLILKELFSNAMRHGKASFFSIQLIREADQLTLVVEDNGIGFKIDDPKWRAGLGIHSIRNRMQIMKSDLKIDSVIGRGTIITLEIPLYPSPK